MPKHWLASFDCPAKVFNILGPPHILSHRCRRPFLAVALGGNIVFQTGARHMNHRHSSGFAIELPVNFLKQPQEPQGMHGMDNCPQK